MGVLRSRWLWQMRDLAPDEFSAWRAWQAIDKIELAWNRVCGKRAHAVLRQNLFGGALGNGARREHYADVGHFPLYRV